VLIGTTARRDGDLSVSFVALAGTEFQLAMMLAKHIQEIKILKRRYRAG
jgi:hypothetical protein